MNEIVRRLTVVLDSAHGGLCVSWWNGQMREVDVPELNAGRLAELPRRNRDVVPKVAEFRGLFTGRPLPVDVGATHTVE